MFRYAIFAILLLSLSSFKSTAQDAILILNPVEIDKDKYTDYKGNAYYFDDWTDINVISKGGQEFNNITGNYDQMESNFVVKHQNKFINLPESLYPRIEYTDQDGLAKSFVHQIHPKFQKGYVVVHYSSENIQIIEELRAREQVTVVQKPGETAKIKRIAKKSILHVLRNGEVSGFGRKEKNIVKAFGHKSEVKRFLKENKIKLKKLNDAIKVVKYLDEAGLIK